METAKLFYSGNSQAVRLPREFRFTEDRVYIKRLGSVVVLLPYGDPWRSLLEGLDLFSADFMEARSQGETESARAGVRMRYLLDTNICIQIIRRKPSELLSRLTALPVGDVGLSTITAAELHVGVQKVATQPVMPRR